VVHLRRLYEAYGERAEFLFVHIREEVDPRPEDLQRILDDPNAPQQAEANRRWRLRAEMNYYHLPFRCLLDTQDHRVETLYRASPRRVVLVNTNGRIAVDSGSYPSRPVPWEEIAANLDEWEKPGQAGKANRSPEKRTS
jgi:hypothetical protein